MQLFAPATGAAKKETIAFLENPSKEIRLHGWRGAFPDVDMCPDCAKLYQSLVDGFWEGAYDGPDKTD